jgi:YEATS domain-containing protein 4
MTLNAYKHETDFEDRRKRTESSLVSGRAKVKEEIADFKEKLQLANGTIDKFKMELARAKRARAME